MVQPHFRAGNTLRCAHNAMLVRRLQHGTSIKRIHSFHSFQVSLKAMMEGLGAGGKDKGKVVPVLFFN